MKKNLSVIKLILLPYKIFKYRHCDEALQKLKKQSCLNFWAGSPSLIKIRLATTLISLAFLTACTNVEYSGSQFDSQEVEKIEIGSSLESVVDRLGTPVHVSPFGEKKYFYIKNKIQNRPILDPKVCSTDIAEITFDCEDKVSDVQIHCDLKPTSIPNYSRRQHIEGSELTPMQQIISNIGKYNTKKKAVGK